MQSLVHLPRAKRAALQCTTCRSITSCSQQRSLWCWPEPSGCVSKPSFQHVRPPEEMLAQDMRAMQLYILVRVYFNFLAH